MHKERVRQLSHLQLVSLGLEAADDVADNVPLDTIRLDHTVR